jgi:flagellar motility protein MotE (MotC chaperone)
VQELRKLDASYARVTGALTRKQDATRTNVTRFLDDAQKHKAVASSQLQNKLAEAAQVQQDIVDAQGRFRKAARDLLTREQQMVAEGS